MSVTSDCGSPAMDTDFPDSSPDYQEWFQETFHQPAVGMAHVSPDGRILRVNDRLCEMLGFDRDHLLSKTFPEITHPEDRDEDLSEFEQLLNGVRDTYTIEKRYVGSEGRVIWGQLTVKAVRDETGDVDYLVGVVEDESDRKSVESERARLSTIVDVQHKVAMTDLELDTTIREVADAARKVTGAEGATVELARGQDLVYRGVSGSTEEFVGLRFPVEKSFSGRAYRDNEILVCNDSQEDDRVADKDKARQIGFISGICVPMYYKNRTFGVIKVISGTPNAFDEQDRSTLELLSGLLSSQISHSLRFEDTLLDAQSDNLTGLKNRRSLMEELNIEMERARRSEDPLSLVMIDIDHFKLVNDSHGHVVGDRVLEEIGRILHEETRSIDTAFRYGGEEFAILVPEETRKGATQLANRVREALSERSFTGKKDDTFHVTCSAGVAEFDSQFTPKEFVDSADRALYSAKQDGRDRVANYREIKDG